MNFPADLGRLIDVPAFGKEKMIRDKLILLILVNEGLAKFDYAAGATYRDLLASVTREDLYLHRDAIIDLLPKLNERLAL